MALTLQNPEKDAPRADGFTILVRHKTRQLVKVSKVVNGPRGEKLAESDRAEVGVAPATMEIAWAQVHGVKLRQTLCTRDCEFIKQLWQLFPLRFFVLALSIKRFESPLLTMLKDHGGAWNPIRVFSVEKVADDIESSPRFRSFVRVCPGYREIAEKGIESGRRAREKRSRF